MTERFPSVVVVEQQRRQRSPAEWSSLTGRRRLSVCFGGVKCRAAAAEEPLYAGSVSMEPAF